MKYWMLTLTCISFLPASLAFASGDNSVADAADKVFRDGVVFCNQASKLSRTDTKEARQQFSQYLSHLERAKTIDKSLLENNSFAERENKRCALIDDNIARAEAMPIVEESLEQCAKARTALEASDLKLANASLQRFSELRDEALKVTPTVLRVGSVAVRMRVCDRMVEKISLAESAQQLALQKASRALGSYDKALASCDAGRSMLSAAKVSNETVTAVNGVLRQLNQHQSGADALAKELTGSTGESQRLSAIRNRVSSCNKELVAAVKSMQIQLEQQALAVNILNQDDLRESPQEATLAVQADVTMLQGREIVQIGDGSL